MATEHSISASGKKESQQQDFNYFPIYANEPCDVYEAMSVSFDKEIWDDRTAYWTIDKAPPVLQFSIPRLTYNVAKQVEERNTNQLKLHPHIFLDRFMANDEMLRKRELFWRYRDELRKRKTARNKLRPPDKDQSASELLESLSDYLKALKDDANDGLPVHQAELHDSLKYEATYAKAEVERLESEMLELRDRMSEVFSTDKGQFKYGLQAVFVHRGSTRSGHWFTYMYDARGDKWRKYNDEEVEIIDAARVKDEIYEPNEALRGTTALAVYALEERWGELFEPVHRDPEPEPESAAWPQSDTQGSVQSQTSTLPPANMPYEGARQSENRFEWDTNRDVGEGNVTW